jgi:hypothetical protein
MASIDIDALLGRFAVETAAVEVIPDIGVEGHFAGAQADLADAVYITSNLWRCKKANRVNDCFGAAYLQISECLHGNPTYKVEDTTAKGTHTIECQWCTTPFEPEQHNFVDKVCTVCGVTETFGTGVKEVRSEEVKSEKWAGAWYNIDGRKLNEKPTTKGVYISRGKKVVIK